MEELLRYLALLYAIHGFDVELGSLPRERFVKRAGMELFLVIFHDDGEIEVWDNPGGFTGDWTSYYELKQIEAVVVGILGDAWKS